MDETKRQTLQIGSALLMAGLPLADRASAAANTATLDPAATILVNSLTCDPPNQAALLDLLRENTNAVITTLDGWKSTSLVASQDGARVTIISQWRDPAAVRAMQADERMKAYFPRIAALAKFDSVVGNIVYAHHA